MAATAAGPIRSEIQALRALAVALVLAYHFWPRLVPGGFVGVDVFFVISGFLITAGLVREAEATGRVRLAHFWARRARRILPAAVLVLATCALASVLLVPPTIRGGWLEEIAASALYVENWHLAASSVDYLAADDAPSAVRHFWSLSVEEQVYLVWPLLVLAGVAFVRDRRRGIAVALGLVTVASLAWSAYATASDPGPAYFATPARAWELGAGALLALLPPPATDRRRMLLAAAGVVGIALAAATFSSATAMPGVAALLPVFGAAAIIRAQVAPRPVRLRPVQWLGDVSYGAYLWHWPLLVLAPFAVGHDVRDGERVALLVITLLAAGLSKRLVEDPVRRARAGLRPGRTLLAGAAASLAVVAATTAGGSSLEEDVRRAEREVERVLAAPPPCFGAAARDPRRRCARAARRRTVVPSPLAAQRAPNAPCWPVGQEGLLYKCQFGVRLADSARSIALVGDSHASHWRAALDPVADRRRWRAISIARSSCPFRAGVPALPEPERSTCLRWARQVPAWFRRNPEFSTVVVAQFAGARVETPPGADVFETQVAAYTSAWRSLPRSVRRIVVLRDTPRMRRANGTLACVERAMDAERDAAQVCRRPRDVALPPDPAAEAARRMGGRVKVVDLTRLMCGPRWCPAVVGGALVHKDSNHMTSVFAATLAPYLERRLAPLVWRPPRPREQ